jgi:hypothetical protein
MIALFLVTMFALPMAQLPLKALREETNTAYRMQLHRYGDLAFAEFKEELYQQKIPWKKLCTTKKEPLNEGKDVNICFTGVGNCKLHRTIAIKSCGKKGKNGEEWRLVTFDVKFTSPNVKKLWLRKAKSRKNPNKRVLSPIITFTYKILVGKDGLIAEAPAQESQAPSPIKDVVPELHTPSG